MAKKSGDQHMRGEDIQRVFNDDSVSELERKFRALEAEFIELEAQYKAETVQERVDELLEKVKEKRQELSDAHRVLLHERRKFTDIAQGGRR